MTRAPLRSSNSWALSCSRSSSCAFNSCIRDAVEIGASDSQLQMLVRRLLRSNRPDTDTPVIISTMEGGYCSLVGRLLERGGARVSALVDIAFANKRAHSRFFCNASQTSYEVSSPPPCNVPLRHTPHLLNDETSICDPSLRTALRLKRRMNWIPVCISSEVMVIFKFEKHFSF